MVFSSNPSSFYLPLDSDQGVTFYKNENSLFSAPTSAVVCRGGNQGNTMEEVVPFGNNSHGTVVVDAVVRHDFAPVAHLSSNGYYGYVPPSQKMMSTPAATAVNGNVQLEDAAMDCGGEMENFQQLQQNQQHQRKRKEYGGEEAMVAGSKRRKTWLQGEEEQQQAAFPQSFGWNQLPYAPHQQQMDCHVEDTPMTMTTTTTVIGSCNGTFAQIPQPATAAAVTIPVATVTPIQVPKNHLSVNGHSGGSVRRDLLGRWNIAMPSSRSTGTGCSTVDRLSEKLHSHQQTHIGGGDGGQELEDLFVSLHGSGFFLAG